jgi:hypothetical protein
MNKIVFVSFMFTICVVEAVDKRPFDEIVDNFRAGNYEEVVNDALALARNDASGLKNDSKFFLREFFNIMASENERLESLRENVSLLCGNITDSPSTAELGYSLNYADMEEMHRTLAVEKYTATKNILWVCIPSMESEDYSEGDEELSDDVALDLNSDDEEDFRVERFGTELSVNEIIGNARIRFGWRD